MRLGVASVRPGGSELAWPLPARTSPVPPACRAAGAGVPAGGASACGPRPCSAGRSVACRPLRRRAGKGSHRDLEGCDPQRTPRARPAGAGTAGTGEEGRRRDVPGPQRGPCRGPSPGSGGTAAGPSPRGARRALPSRREGPPGAGAPPAGGLGRARQPQRSRGAQCAGAPRLRAVALLTSEGWPWRRHWRLGRRYRRMPPSSRPPPTPLRGSLAQSWRKSSSAPAVLVPCPQAGQNGCGGCLKACDGSLRSDPRRRGGRHPCPSRRPTAASALRGVWIPRCRGDEEAAAAAAAAVAGDAVAEDAGGGECVAVSAGCSVLKTRGSPTWLLAPSASGCPPQSLIEPLEQAETVCLPLQRQARSRRRRPSADLAVPLPPRLKPPPKARLRGQQREGLELILSWSCHPSSRFGSGGQARPTTPLSGTACCWPAAHCRCGRRGPSAGSPRMTAQWPQQGRTSDARSGARLAGGSRQRGGAPCAPSFRPPRPSC
mmetsp:Transcript_18485/g.70080  ORF Transcript_18485/g.70080 Transcript_18485/m.70080 type:complete len:489 (+) Transcript_18485:834-2300(+)